MPAASGSSLEAFSGMMKLGDGLPDAFVDVRPSFGDREPIIFLGGLSFGKERSDLLADELEKRAIPLVRIDQIGTGRTLLNDIVKANSASLKNPILIRNQVRLIEAVRQQLKLKRVAVAGLSYGGPIATAYARAYPGHTSKLFLMAPYVVSFENQDPFASAMNSLARLNPIVSMAYDLTLSNTLSVALSDKVPPYLENYLTSYQTAVFQMSKGLDQFDLRVEVRGLQVPTYILGAKGDPVVTRPLLQQVRSQIPASLKASYEEIEAQHDIVGSKPVAAAAWIDQNHR
jgi:pimeloyl-ACP methyl ester carboxylesterase